MTPAQEQRVVAEATRWLRTPYHHAADVLGVGTDCAMLVVRVFVDAGICAPFDPRPYPPDWHLHRDQERYIEWVARSADRLPKGAAPRPGDLAMFRFARAASHGGIVESIDANGEIFMIHADRDAGEVCRCEVRRWTEADGRGKFDSYWRVR